MRIYTKTGDQGETGLLGGVRVSKSHLAVRVCGALDETSSFLGLAGCEPLPEDVGQVLIQVQHDLFDLGSRVAACMAKKRPRRGFSSDTINGTGKPHRPIRGGTCSSSGVHLTQRQSRWMYASFGTVGLSARRARVGRTDEFSSCSPLGQRVGLPESPWRSVVCIGSSG